jgi:hypothetical protein
MSATSSIVPLSPRTREILLPASFAACGALLVGLFLVLIGCSSFGSAGVVTVTPNNVNAILCSCQCEGIVPTAAPMDHLIVGAADDVSQPPAAATAILDRPTLVLGQGFHVGLRFAKLGVPQGATITSAFVQFTSAQTDQAGSAADLTISVVNASNAAPFTPATDLTSPGLNLTGSVAWSPPAWTVKDRGTAERTADLTDLVQAVVSRLDFTPDSAIAFVITGSGTGRTARAIETANLGKPAGITVTYTPKTLKNEFLACGDPTKGADVCTGAVQTAVSGIAQQCKLANSCVCTFERVDANNFSAACNASCDPKAPDNCDSQEIAKATVAKPGDPPVCVAHSPLGSVLFGQRSACDIDPSQSNVHARIFKDDDSSSSDSTPQGRIEFLGAPCPDGSCAVGMAHRMNLGDMTFPSHSILASDAHVNQLSGVGENTAVGAFIFNDGTGSFSPGLTSHAVRGNQVGGDTVAVLRPNDGRLAISIGVDATQPGSWRPGGICTMKSVKDDGTPGLLFTAGNQDDGGIEMSVDIKGTLVNQPPTASLNPADTIECNDIGIGAFALDPSAHDPDNNVAWFGWFKGGPTGEMVGARSTLETEQAVNETALYVFKVTDTFGQHAEARTEITVKDTTAPSVTAPGEKTVECTSPAGTPVDLGTATAADVCDASPAIGNNAPALFPLGDSTVTWSGTDASGNKGFATQLVHVQDTTPPNLTVTLSPTSLWPPNHKLVPITATITVTDKCDPHPFVRLVSITSNEPMNGVGDGNTDADIQGVAFGTDDRTFQLRSERSGPGDGRVYTVTYQASDHSGNTTTKTATVTAPHNK